MITNNYQIAGFIINNPLTEDILGFVTPFFQIDESFYLQNISKENMIEKFVPIDKPEDDEVLLFETKEIVWKKEDALFAFAFSKSDIVWGKFEDVADNLRERIHELSAYPSIRSEVAQFLGDTEEYLNAVDDRTKKLKPLSEKIAEELRTDSYERVLSEIFVGRLKEKSEFEEFLSDSHVYSVLNIHTNGDGGIGKTQLLLQFQMLCRKSEDVKYNKNLIDFYHTDARTQTDIMRLIAEGIGSDLFPKFKEKLNEYNNKSGDKKTLIAELTNVFNEEYKSLSHTKVALFFDTYEVIQGTDFSKWLENAFFPSLWKLNPNTHIIVAGRKPLRLISHKTIELKSFDLQDTVHFLKICFTISSDEELENIIGGKDAVSKIHNFAKGRPILLALFADWCKPRYNRISPKDIIDKIEKAFQEKEAPEKERQEFFEKILIDEILSLKAPENEAVLYMAFAYRRMNPKMFTYISGISLEESSQTLLKKLRPLSFIKYRTEKQNVLLHDEMRDLINRHYWDIKDPDRKERKEIASKLVTYYDQFLLSQKELSSMEKAVLYAERLYYQLYADINIGFKEFCKEFDRYLDNYEIYFCDLIGSEVLSDQFYPHLSFEQRLELIIRRIRWRNEQNRWKDALAFFEDGYGQKEIPYIQEDREYIGKFEKKEKNTEEEKLREAYFLHERGVARLWTGQLEGAVSDFSKSEEAFRQSKDMYRVVWELTLLGYALYRKGDFSNADIAFSNGIYEFTLYIKLYIKQCVQKSESIPENAYYRISNIYSNYNALFRHMGRFFEAVLCGEIALSIIRKKSHHREMSRFLNAMGETCKNLNRISEASKFYKEAEIHLESAPDQLLKARIFIGKALIDYRHQDYIYILEFYRKESRKRAIANFMQMYPSAVKPSEQKEDWHENSEAAATMEFLAEAQEILTANIRDETNELADLYFYMADALTIQDDWKMAIELFKKSEKTAESVHNEYRKTDAIVGQIISYYFLRSDENSYNNEINECVEKIKDAKHIYFNLLGKMEIILANIEYEKFLSTYEDKKLYESIKKYIIACNYMYSFSRISKSRFYVIFQIIVKRMADISLGRIPSEETLENLKNIWLYDLGDKEICRKYRSELDEIIEFSILRIGIRESKFQWKDIFNRYTEKVYKGIEDGGEKLRFTPMYGLMNLQIHKDFWGAEHPKTAEAYMDLAHTHALNDNLFEARQNNGIALNYIENSRNDLLKARICIRLGTISYRRGEYGRLVLKSRKQNIRENLDAYYQENEKDLKQSGIYFDQAEEILDLLSRTEPHNNLVNIKLAHLYFRKAECLYIMNENFSKIESLFKNSREKAAAAGGDIWREMAALEGLISFYYLSNQWEKKQKDIQPMLEDFFRLNRKRYAPVLMGRLQITKGDILYDEISSHPTDLSCIEESFSYYIMASRMMADYSDKHFYEAISTIIDRIENLPKKSAKILYQEIFPKIQQKRPKREVAEDAYRLVENCLFIHSEVL